MLTTPGLLSMLEVTPPHSTIDTSTSYEPASAAIAGLIVRVGVPDPETSPPSVRSEPSLRHWYTSGWPKPLAITESVTGAPAATLCDGVGCCVMAGAHWLVSMLITPGLLVVLAGTP